MPETNSNPESTWGASTEQKEAWAAQYAPEMLEPVVPVEEDSTPDTSVGDSPESTWNKPVEDKIEWRQANVPDFDVNDPDGSPTEVGINDEALILAPPVDLGYADPAPVVEEALQNNDSPPVAPPIQLPVDTGLEAVDPTVPAAPSDPNVDGSGVQDEMTVEKIDPPAESEQEAPADNDQSTEPTQEEVEEAPVAPEDQPPVDIRTVDGQENTANPTSSTGGADVSQPGSVVDTPGTDASAPTAGDANVAADTAGTANTGAES